MTATAVQTSPACPRCGRALPADAPAGLCPRCLLSDGFGGQSDAEYRPRTGDGRRFVPPTIEELAGEFPNLEFVRPLGSGGMGAVYLAKQIRLDRPIAVKVLPPDLADDQAFAERFLREARALARLSHPNIVSVFDFGQTPGGLFFFLMEYIEGPTLRQVVASRSTNPKQALEIVRQVCDALQYAHDKGVVHRDIKPENILLDGHGRVKIADFGLAKLLGLADTPAGSPAAGSLTHTQQAMGTPHYMAPEQIVGSRGVDHRADIYSLGVVFYELLTGELPLGRFAPPSKKVQLDVRLDEVVLRSLEAEPAQRYQRASDVRTAVDSIESAPTRGAAATAALRFVREASAGASRTAATVLRSAGSGRTSPKVIAALAWLVAIPIAVLLFSLAAANQRNDAIEIPLMLIGIPFAIAAITSVVGGPILAASAIRDIRESRGAISGLVPAAAAMLALPLLLLNAMIVWVCGIPFVLVFGHDDPRFLVVGLIVGLPVLAWANRRIVRSMWRNATEGLPPEVAERELAVIPTPARDAGAAVAAWCDAVWSQLRGYSGNGTPAGERGPGAAMAGPFAVAPGPAIASPTVVRREPRFSRKAVIGAVWASTPLVFLSAVALVEDLPGWMAPRHPLYVAAMVVASLTALPAVTAPIGTTILGWTAVGDVRRSGGRMTGLGLAVFDGLLFPLLALDLFLAAAMAGVTAAVAAALGLFPPQAGESLVILVPLLGVLTMVGLCAVVDAVIARSVWRRVTAGLTQDGAIGPMEGREARHEAAVVEPGVSIKAIVGTVWATAGLAGAVLLVLLANTHREEPARGVIVVLLGLVALPALTAPVGTTVLGWLAVGNIRQSGGRMSGLGLAVFDGLAFPLVALNAGIAAAVTGLTMAAIVLPGLRAPGDEFAMTAIGFGGAAVGVVLCVVVDLLVVRSVWRRVSGGERAADSGEPRWGRRELYIGLALVSVAVVLFALKAARDGASTALVTPPVAGPPPAPPVPPTGGDGMMPGTMDDMKVRWRLGPKGAELSAGWAMIGLGLDGEEREQVNAVLRDVHSQYERVLDAHTTVAYDRDGRGITFTVEPFPGEYERLADEFWGRVDPLLTRDQQTIMRYNFPLKADLRDNVMSERYEGRVMPFGGPSYSSAGGTTIRIARSGQWYQWSIVLPNMSTRGEAPEMPLWLRHWQERYDLLDSLRRSGAAVDPKRPPLIARKPARRAEDLPEGMGAMMMEGSMEAEGGEMGSMMGGPAY